MKTFNHDYVKTSETKARTMKTPLQKLTTTAALALGMAAFSTSSLSAQLVNFGTGPNQFGIEFLSVGNPANADDSTGYGGVGYTYGISKFEVSQNDIAAATNSGMTNVTAGAWSANQPAAGVTWLEAAAFVNWLNTSKGFQAAYNLTYSTSTSSWSMVAWGAIDQASTGVDSGTNPFRHKDAVFFLPSEDEWYKAAYHQNNGITGDYWDYATGSNTTPTAVASGTLADTAVYNNTVTGGNPASVLAAGGLSSYGTMGQSGNVWEWTESIGNGLNDNVTASRVRRGGFYNTASSGSDLSPSGRLLNSLAVANGSIGFRVAAIPEPSSAALLLGGLAALTVFRRRRRG